MGAKIRRRFPFKSGRYYEAPIRCTSRKRFRLTPLEDGDQGYDGDNEMKVCERIWMHSYWEDQREMEKDIKDEEWISRKKKRRLQLTANKTEKGAVVDEEDTENLLIWPENKSERSMSPIPELVELNRVAEGRIESGYKPLEEISSPVNSEFDIVYADIEADADAIIRELLCNLANPLQDEIASREDAA